MRERGTRSPDVALVVSGQLRAALCYGDQELTIFNIGRGQLLMTNPGLILRAREDAELLITSRRAFVELLSSSPELVSSAFCWLETQMDRTLRIIEGIRFLSVKARLIRFIVDLCTDSGRDVLDGTSVPFEYTIEEVANEIGASRQSTSQTFNELIKEKYIVRVSRTQLIVPSLAKLGDALRDAEANTVRLTVSGGDQPSRAKPDFTEYLRDVSQMDEISPARDGTDG